MALPRRVLAFVVASNGECRSGFTLWFHPFWHSSPVLPRIRAAIATHGTGGVVEDATITSAEGCSASLYSCPVSGCGSRKFVELRALLDSNLEYHRFLRSASALSSKQWAISAHFLLHSHTLRSRISSSSFVHSPFRIAGSRYLGHRSQHCLALRVPTLGAIALQSFVGCDGFASNDRLIFRGAESGSGHPRKGFPQPTTP
jgi:hypothetical protein